MDKKVVNLYDLMAEEPDKKGFRLLTEEQGCVKVVAPVSVPIETQNTEKAACMMIRKDFLCCPVTAW